MSQLRMISDDLNFLEAIWMVRQEDAQQKVAVSGGGVELRSRPERLEIFGLKIAADALLELEW